MRICLLPLLALIALSIKPVPAYAAECTVTAISANQTITGSLASSDCVVADILSISDNSKVDVFELTLGSSGAVTINLESSAFDPFLRLLDSNQATLAQDDDSGTGFNARISTTLDAGTYRILANSATSSTELGDYTLTTTGPEGSSPAAATRLVNISTRASVQTGDGVTIGGLIIEGSQDKTVVIRAIGPDLANRGVNGVLLDTQLQLFSGSDLIDSNDDWNTHSRKDEIPDNLVPAFQLESVIVATLAPGAYTAIVRGAGESSGVGLVEIFETDADSSKLVNISTRGAVGTGDNVMIGGIIISGTEAKTVLVRALGPSLESCGVPGSLQDPFLQIFSGADLLENNNNWRDHGRASEIPSGLSPEHSNEAAMIITLEPGAYTAIVSGVGGATGIGLIEVFEVN